MQFVLKSSRLFYAALITLFIVSSCSKDPDPPAPPPIVKETVKVSSLTVDDNSKLFHSPFAGKLTGQIYVSLIAQAGAASDVVTLQPTTIPAVYADNMKFFVKNDDGSNADPSTYSLTGKNISFFKLGVYRISGSVPEGDHNKVSDTSSEIRIQVTSNIPDTNFRAKLKSMPGLIFKNEVLDTSSAILPAVPQNWTGTWDMSNLHIQSFEGINYFKTLLSLTCTGNDIVTLNINQLVNLKYLECWSTAGLTTLDLTANTQLSNISIANNTNLQTLSLSNLHHLDALNFNNCKVDTINLAGLDSLRTFSCSGSPLISLNLSGSPLLESLYAPSTQAISVDIRGLHNLSDVSVSDGPLAQLLIDTVSSSYPFLGSLYVPHDFKCNPSLKTLKSDLGSNIWIVLEDLPQPTVYDFNPLTDCP